MKNRKKVRIKTHIIPKQKELLQQIQNSTQNQSPHISPQNSPQNSPPHKRLPQTKPETKSSPNQVPKTAIDKKFNHTSRNFHLKFQISTKKNKL